MNRIRPEIAVNEAMNFAKMFLIPVTAIFMLFFIIMNAVQISAFAKGLTPYPKWCAVFCMLIGIFDIVIMKIVGNQAWACALSTGWLSVGSMITFAGLLINMKKARTKVKQSPGEVMERK